MVAKKKTSSVDNINARLSLVVKSGKISLGHRTTIKALRKSQAKLVLIANNCPPLRKSEIEYYCMLAKVMVVPYNGNNTDMGTAVGQFFRVSAMTILDPGDSDILKQTASSDKDDK